MAIFPIKKKPEKKPKVQDNGEFLHQVDIELIVGTYLNSNDITMTDENHKKLLEEALSYFHETLDDYDLRGAEDYMSTPKEYQFLFRDAKEADILEDDIIGFVENYNVEDKIQDKSLEKLVPTIKRLKPLTKDYPNIELSFEVEDDDITLTAKPKGEIGSDEEDEDLDEVAISLLEIWAEDIAEEYSMYAKAVESELASDWHSGMSLYNDGNTPFTYNFITLHLYMEEDDDTLDDAKIQDELQLIDQQDLLDSLEEDLTLSVTEYEDKHGLPAGAIENEESILFEIHEALATTFTDPTSQEIINAKLSIREKISDLKNNINSDYPETGEELTVRNLLTKKGSFDVTNDYADDFVIGYDGEEEFPLTPEGEEYFTDVLDLKVDFNDNAVVLINHLDNAEEVAKKVSQLFRGLTGVLKDEYDKYFVLFAEDKLQDNEIPFETIFWGIYDNEFDLPFDKTVEYIHEKYADKIWQDEGADGDLSVLTDEEEQDIIEFAKDEALNWDSLDIYNSHARYKSDQVINDQLEKYFGIKNTKMYKMQDNKINIPELLTKEIAALGDKSRKADLDEAIATIKANRVYPMVYDVYVGSLIEQEKDNLLNALVKNKDLTVFNYGGMFKVLTKEDELKLMEA